MTFTRFYRFLGNSPFSNGPIFLTFFVVTFAIPLVAQPPNYSFAKQIIVNSGQVSGTTDLNNFVTLVSLTDNDLRTTSNGGNVENTNGYDIIFTLDDCSTILDHQIESYNASTGEYIAWVRIPTLFATFNTEIQMYYGNNTVTLDPSTTNVWGAEYAAVWHMNQSPASAAPQIQDYTANTNDGIANGGMAAGDLVNGYIGQGIDFDGNNDFIDCGSDASTDPNGSLTVSAWIFSRAASGHIINRGGGWNDPGYSLFHHANNIRIELQRAGEKDIVDNGLTINTWHHVALTYDNVSGTIRCYIDGIQQGNTGNHTGPMGNPVENLNIGRKEQNAFYFNGIIDEGRVIHARRNGDWMRTEFNNQSNPAGFYSVSSEMTASALCPSPLPVELLNFTATYNDGKVDLVWETASELNNDFFTIYRSTNGTEWEPVSTIDGAGNSNSINTYFIHDYKPLLGKSYYKLKQTDFNGEYEYSSIRSIDVLDEGNIEAFPNPFTSELILKGKDLKVGEIEVYNILGQNVNNLLIFSSTSETEIQINTSALEEGAYFLRTPSRSLKIVK